MKAPPKALHPLVKSFRDASELFDAPKLTRMRGRIGAPILLIAPAPTAEDLANNLPMSDDGAEVAHRILLSLADIDTEKDCTVLPGSILPKKASKRLIEPFGASALKHAKDYRLILCVGGDNFKFIFGKGKKSSLTTLANGDLIYLPRLVGNVPVLVLPEYTMLAPPWEHIAEEEHWKIERLQVRLTDWYNRIATKLSSHVKKQGIKH